MDNSINKSRPRNFTRAEMEPELLENFGDIQNELSPFALLSENIWKNTYGIQALFIVNSKGKTLYSKFSKYFDEANSEQLDSIILSSCSCFTSTRKMNPMKISIGVFEKFTTMTSEIGDYFIIMIVPNNTNIGSSVQFAENIALR
ncbi:MAG: hypothetical protein OEM21_10425 [Nitrosopumilus sp.]|nr:hypothetical protein [Nitrosopumilus sp.]